MQQFDGHLPCVREAKLLSYENIKHFDRMFESENKIKKPILKRMAIHLFANERKYGAIEHSARGIFN